MDIANIKKRKPITDINKYSFTIYGAPSIGKTSLCAYLFDEPLYFAWEQGQNALNAYVQDMFSWQDVIEFIKQVKRIKKDGGEVPFKSVIIDTTDIMRDKCEEYVCRMNGWDSPADKPMGGGWADVRHEFEKRISEIRSLGLTVHFIAHDKVQSVERKDIKYDKITLFLGSTAVNEVIKKVDFILYLDKEFEKDQDGNVVSRRVVRFDGGENYVAKSRVKGFPEFIYAGDSPKETADKIKGLFYENTEKLLEEVPSEQKKEVSKEVKKEKKVTEKDIDELTKIITQKIKDKKIIVDEVNKIVKENTSVELVKDISNYDEFIKVKDIIENL